MSESTQFVVSNYETHSHDNFQRFEARVGLGALNDGVGVSAGGANIEIHEDSAQQDRNKVRDHYEDESLFRLFHFDGWRRCKMGNGRSKTGGGVEL